MRQTLNTLANPLKTKMRTKWLLCLVIATLSLVLELSFRIPIYIDEIGWKILHARYFLDKQVSITLFPQCRLAFTHSQPNIFLLPSFRVSALRGSLKFIKVKIYQFIILNADFLFAVYYNPSFVRRRTKLE